MYETFYQLTAEPFRLSPDPRFCFQHRTYRKAMTYMRHALLRAEGFIMITGRPGTGKTTLIKDLLQTLKPDQALVANLVTTQMTADDLIRLVAYSYNLNPEGADKVDVLVRVVRFLKQHYQQGRRPLLIVDEAQDMTEDALEELRLLTNLQTGGQQLLQIFLIGQEQLRDMVNAPSMEQLHQRMIAATHLEPLDCQDTEAYIKHRLRRVAWTGNPLISKEAYTMIQQYSQGIPRQINQICSRLFLHGSIEEKHRLGILDVKIVVEELHQELLMPMGTMEKSAAVPRPADPQQETYEEEPRRQPPPSVPKTALQTTPLTATPRKETEPARQKPTSVVPATLPAMPENKPPAAASSLASNDQNHGQQAENADMEPDTITKPGISTIQVPFKQAASTARESPADAPPEQATTREQVRPATEMAASRKIVTEDNSAVELTVRIPDQVTSGINKAHKYNPWRLLAMAALIISLTLLLIYQTNPELTRLAGQNLMAWIPSGLQKGGSDETRESSPDITEPGEDMGIGAVVRELSPVSQEPKNDSAELETTADVPNLNLPDAKQLRLEEELQQSGLLVERMDDDILKVNLSSDGMFAFDSAWIKDNARPALVKLADVLRNYDDISIQIVGHTDSYGVAEYNLNLSQRRAKAVADNLISQGLTESSIQSEGRGDRDTRQEDSTSHAPDLRRRVEIYIRRVKEG